MLHTDHDHLHSGRRHYRDHRTRRDRNVTQEKAFREQIPAMADEYMTWCLSDSSDSQANHPGYFKSPSGDSIPFDSGWVTLNIVDVFCTYISFLSPATYAYT